MIYDSSWSPSSASSWPCSSLTELERAKPLLESQTSHQPFVLPSPSPAPCSCDRWASFAENSTDGSSYMTDIWLTLPHKNHVKPNALTSLICPGSNQNIFLWQVHCLNRSNFFTKCKNRKVWASVPNFLVCQLIDCTVVDNLSKAKMSPIVTGVPWH